MKKEIRIFLTAVMFYTRIPCPSWVDHNSEYLSKGLRYLPLIGIIVGVICAAVYFVSSFVFSYSIAILLSMITGIIVTGAFHEDGLADAFDGFGGGFSKTDILRIMKDSRIGTYGVIGLLSILSLKFVSLSQMTPLHLVIAIIAGNALSRFAATTLLYTYDYVRETEFSKVKSAASRISMFALIVGGLLGIIPLFLFLSFKVFLTIIPVLGVSFILGKFFLNKIGGVTGDCLGATQQICEVVFYLSLLVLWKFI